MAKDFGNLMKSIRQEKAQQESKEPVATDVPVRKSNSKKTTSARSSVKPSTKTSSKKTTKKPAKHEVDRQKPQLGAESSGQLSGAIIPPLDAQQIKRNRVRKNYSFDPDFVEALEAYCAEHNVSSSRLIEYTLSKFIGFK